MNLLEALLIVSPFVYFYGVALIIYYWAKKTRRYLVPSVFGVLAHVAVIPLFAAILALGEGETLAGVFNDFGQAFVIVVSCGVLIFGMLTTAIVILYVNDRQLPALLYLVFIVVITMTPVLDELQADPVLYVESLLQGSETEFEGHRIYLGDSYLYQEAWDGLVINKISPGFAGVEDGFYMSVSAGLHEKMMELDRLCLDENNQCEQDAPGPWQTVTLTEQRSSNNYKWTSVFYFNRKCDVYLRGLEDPGGRLYIDFVERFFSDNC